MDSNLKAYYDSLYKPWGKMFYTLLWEQLSFLSDCKILDYGSGFGITACHLAANNDVIAIEPNLDMIHMRAYEHEYRQIWGGAERLKDFKDATFDVIICHNVLEYISNRDEVFREFVRLVKPYGWISLVMHNHTSRVMEKVFFESDLREILDLMEGGPLNIKHFGKIDEYTIDDIMSWSDEICIEDILGIRNFWPLQEYLKSNEMDDWKKLMIKAELKACDKEIFKNMAFFHHILIRKRCEMM